MLELSFREQILTYLIQLNHVRMSDFLENVDLSCDPLNVTLVFDSVFLKDLDGYFLLGSDADAQFDLAKGTFTQVSFKDVLSNLLELFR